jgi:isopenicillin N synthase-like dioxygenase
MTTHGLIAIDVGPLFKDPTTVRDAVDQAIGHACQEARGFVAIGLPNKMGPSEARAAELLSLFQLPAEALFEIAGTRTNPKAPRSYRGYNDGRISGTSPNQNYDLGPDPTVSGPELEDIERMLEPNAYPEPLPVPDWDKKMIRYFRDMEAFGVLIIESMARFLGVHPDAAAARYQDGNSTLRLLNYPGAARQSQADSELIIGGAHTDNCGLSLLWQDFPGLQFQDSRDSWLDVPQMPSAISVHLGEAMTTQSSGRLQATPHRVVGRGRSRRSIGFFLEPNPFASVLPFSKGAEDPTPPQENTYAASLIATLRATGRA